MDRRGTQRLAAPGARQALRISSDSRIPEWRTTCAGDGSLVLVPLPRNRARVARERNQGSVVQEPAREATRPKERARHRNVCEILDRAQGDGRDPARTARPTMD